MLVKDIMTVNVVTINQNQTLLELPDGFPFGSKYPFPL